VTLKLLVFFNANSVVAVIDVVVPVLVKVVPVKDEVVDCVVLEPVIVAVVILFVVLEPVIVVVVILFVVLVPVTVVMVKLLVVRVSVDVFVVIEAVVAAGTLHAAVSVRVVWSQLRRPEATYPLLHECVHSAPDATVNGVPVAWA
jgi:hypothetical protein